MEHFNFLWLLQIKCQVSCIDKILLVRAIELATVVSRMPVIWNKM